MAKKRFVTNCVDAGPKAEHDLVAMTDAARQITRHTFLSHVDRKELWEIEQKLGYDLTTRYGGLSMAKDWHVSYWRSRFRGKPVVYFCWSAIEYIFAEGCHVGMTDGKWTW